MNGAVNDALRPVLTLTVQSPDGRQAARIDAVLDTGFDGFLTLPTALVASMGLPFVARRQALIADGSVVEIDTYAATVLWGGQPLRVEAEAIDSLPLLGMQMLLGHEVRIAAVPGGAVSTTPIP